jgi:hypothetical protein
MIDIMKWFGEHKEVVLAFVNTFGWLIMAIISLIIIVFIILRAGIV